jgi:thiamine-phosphate pyrophosphorylase
LRREPFELEESFQKSMPFKLPGLYPITDSRLTGLSHAEQVLRLIRGGARLIQLREKHLDAREFFREAEAAMSLAREAGVRLIINDRVDIALATGADGVHLGQDDLPPEAARRILGERAVIGFSTHNIEQAMAAARLPIDYLAIGPIFPTSSKENPDPTVGLDGLRRVREAVPSLPLVAIGGITLETAQETYAAGADSLAVIGSILADPPQIEARVRDWIARF